MKHKMHESEGIEKEDKEETEREENKRGGRLEKKRREKEKEPRKGRKHGGKVEGKEPKMRLDKRARGGRMVAGKGEPLSVAGNMTKLPFETKDMGGEEKND